MKTQILYFFAICIVVASCGTSKKLKNAETRYNILQTSYDQLKTELSGCNDSIQRCQLKIASLNNQVTSLNSQLKSQELYNAQMINQLKDLSVISSSQAESIKRSLDNISTKDAYIKDLQSAIARRDSLNIALVLNLKGAIGNLDDPDINIRIDKGVVYIDISDKLLFKSGSYELTEKAREVLGKVAKVVLNQPDIEFMVEGHTDTVPYYLQNILIDNWDLSVKRATSVVRVLQDQYHVPSARMTASGRGEYLPVASNASAEGRALNRRTRIVILPQLDQFFKLLERPN